MLSLIKMFEPETLHSWGPMIPLTCIYDGGGKVEGGGEIAELVERRSNTPRALLTRVRFPGFESLLRERIVLPELKQNKAQRARAESTHKELISARKSSHNHNNKDLSRLR